MLGSPCQELGHQQGEQGKQGHQPQHRLLEAFEGRTGQSAAVGGCMFRAVSEIECDGKEREGQADQIGAQWLQCGAQPQCAGTCAAQHDGQPVVVCACTAPAVRRHTTKPTMPIFATRSMVVMALPSIHPAVEWRVKVAGKAFENSQGSLDRFSPTLPARGAGDSSSLPSTHAGVKTPQGVPPPLSL